MDLTPPLLRLLDAIHHLRADGRAATVALLAQALALAPTTVRRQARLLVKAKVLDDPRAAPTPLGRQQLTPLGEPPLGLAGDAAGGATPDTPPSTPPRSAGDPRRQQRGEGRFNPADLDQMVVSLPLQELLQGLARGDDMGRRFRLVDGRVSLILELNTRYDGGLRRARHRVFDLLVRLGYAQPAADRGRLGMLDAMAPAPLREVSGQYVFAELSPAQIGQLVALEQRLPPAARAVFRLWPDNIVETQDDPSALPTIKADAAARTFGCAGAGIVWAVVDSGIDGSHPHFDTAGNLRDLPPGIAHVDFVDPHNPRPLLDGYGHGSHVAGIIAGSIDAARVAGPVQAIRFERDPSQQARPEPRPLERLSGVAPECKLVSYKVLDGQGQGSVTRVIAALEAIYRANGDGKDFRIHGVNLSLGYPFEPRWFACGHSPLCDVVDRLARSGVVVVAAAGNNGYALTDLGSQGLWGQGRPMSITDPGNAERAITVGSTHRQSPHTFGVSYFSSKGPTGDGRRKPDLLAPGEKIISCASGALPGGQPGQALYKEDSGTSMAAPHVSGAVAAFLSVRREFIGRVDAVKAVFLDSALDLQRDRDMQGHGLLDLLRALQSV